MDTLTNFYNYTPTELSGGLILFNLVTTFILMLVIVYVYKQTRHGLSYSQSFIFTLIIVGVLGTTTMMAVQNNVIGALAIFGAFTLIRFRSILKETSDLAYVFFALVVGISVGMGHYSLALLTVVFLSVIIYLFHRFGFGTVSDNFDYLLIFYATSDLSKDSVQKILDEFTFSRELLSIKYRNDNENEYAYSLKLKKTVSPIDISESMRKIHHVSHVELLTGKNTAEF